VHFFKISSNLLGLKPTTNGIAISLPDGALIRGSHTGTLPVPGLPLSACRAHVFHPCNHIHSFPSSNYAITAAKPSSPITASQSLTTTSFYSRVTYPAPPTASEPSIPLTKPPPQPRRHPVPSTDQSMPCFTPPWRTTMLPIELTFIMPACVILSHPRGFMPSMLDNFQDGLASHPPLSASTSSIHS
jgi:hypothetical protein